MIKFKYFEAELMEYRSYFGENKKERQKFEDWLMQKRFEDTLREYHYNLSRVDRFKEKTKAFKVSLENEEDFINKLRIIEEIVRCGDAIVDYEKKISCLEPKIEEYKDAFNKGDRVE